MRKKRTLEEFITQANLIHDNKYDYSKVEYINTDTKICIVCPIHGEFWMTPTSHLNKRGCPKCGVLRIGQKLRLNTEQFIEKAKSVHGDKYDYSKVEYVNNNTKVCIICPIHGEFWQTPHNHLVGGCYQCGRDKSRLKTYSDTEKFIEKAKAVHGDEYDYSKVVYVKSNIKVCIICSKHGEFWVTPNNHLQGRKCPLCSIENGNPITRLYTTESFVEACKKIHGDKFSYEKTVYKNQSTKCVVTCLFHGDREMLPSNLLRGFGCKKCAMERQAASKLHGLEWFLEYAKKRHGNRYDYCEVEYKGINSKVKIFCTVCKKYFYQSPYYHVSKGHGCPCCNFSHLETEISVILQKYNIEYDPQYKLDRQKLDFYLPQYNVGIECQGEQHFQPSFSRNKEKAEKFLHDNIARDIKKATKCKERGIKLLYYIGSQDWFNNDSGLYSEDNTYFDVEKIVTEFKET